MEFMATLSGPQVVLPPELSPGALSASRAMMAQDGLASKAVIAGSFLSVYLAGYPGSANIRLAVENLQTGRQLPLQMENVPGDSWRLFHFPLPSQWKGQPIRLLVEDNAASPDGWVAFTEPDSMAGLKSEVLFAGRILGLALLLFVVLMLPPAATVVVASPAWSPRPT